MSSEKFQQCLFDRLCRRWNMKGIDARHSIAQLCRTKQQLWRQRDFIWKVSRLVPLSLNNQGALAHNNKEINLETESKNYFFSQPYISTGITSLRFRNSHKFSYRAMDSLRNMQCWDPESTRFYHSARARRSTSQCETSVFIRYVCNKHTISIEISCPQRLNFINVSRMWSLYYFLVFIR